MKRVNHQSSVVHCMKSVRIRSFFSPYFPSFQLVQALNLNFYCNLLKKCVLANFWFLGRGSSLHWTFEKVRTCPPWGIFFRSNYLYWRQQKLKMLISLTYEDVSPLYEILKRRRLCDILLFKYVLIYAYISTFLMLTSVKITKIIWQHQ